MISEGLFCNTEDWSNDCWEKNIRFAITGIKKYFKIENYVL